jgi:hypothetical protein
VALRSSFLSSEVSKLLLVIIKDVRIKKDIGRQQDGEQTAAASTNVPINVKDLRVPPVLISLTQVWTFSMHIYLPLSIKLFRLKNCPKLVNSLSIHL